MVRDWRRAVLATLGTAMLAAAGVLGAHAQAPAGAQPEEETQSAAEPKSPGKRKQDPGDAQRAVDTAGKHLQAGKSELAVQTLSVTLSGGNLPPAVMAKAFYIRGMAYRKLGKPAQAISDLTSALWLKGGLGDEERSAATKERAAAFADAGLAEGGEVPAPSKGGSGNWLSGLFGAPASSAPAPPPVPPPAPPPVPAGSGPKVSSTVIEKAQTAPAASAPSQVVGAWTSKTQTQPGKPVPAAAPPPAPTVAAPASRPAPAAAPPQAAKVAAAPAPKPAPASPPQTAKVVAAPGPAPPQARATGGFLVQLGAVRTEADAQALAAKAKRAHATALAARNQRIDRTVMGNMGAFYRVRFGPFGSAEETQAVCAKLRGSGLDCMPVSQ
jgi:hypothetical protein